MDCWLVLARVVHTHQLSAHRFVLSNTKEKIVMPPTSISYLVYL